MARWKRFSLVRPWIDSTTSIKTAEAFIALLTAGCIVSRPSDKTKRVQDTTNRFQITCPTLNDCESWLAGQLRNGTSSSHHLGNDCVHTLSDEVSRAQVEAGVLRAIANPNRLKVLLLLGRQEMTVGQLASAVGLSYPATSQHLAILFDANTVTRRRAWNRIFYHANSTEMSSMICTLFGRNDLP